MVAAEGCVVTAKTMVSLAVLSTYLVPFWCLATGTGATLALRGGQGQGVLGGLDDLHATQCPSERHLGVPRVRLQAQWW